MKAGVLYRGVAERVTPTLSSRRRRTVSYSFIMYVLMLNVFAEPATPSNQPLTKKQRQNAAKRAAQKDAKVDAEKERLAALQKHKRDLEKTRMAEQASGTGKGKVSGGMKASVDDNGKLVWE